MSGEPFKYRDGRIVCPVNDGACPTVGCDDFGCWRQINLDYEQRKIRKWRAQEDQKDG